MQIRKGFDKKDRETAARLYVEAFKRKFENLIGGQDLIQALFEEAINPSYCLCAYTDEGELVGIAGFHEGEKGFVDIKGRDFIQMFGWFHGSWKALVSDIIFTRKPLSRDELLMDGIAVDAKWRGQGVGTKLFDALVDYGKSKHFKYMKLDVVDENPRAKALYERLGFYKSSYEKVFVLFAKLIGVSGVTTMVKRL